MDLASLGLRLQCDRHSSCLNDLASTTSPTVKRNFFRYTTMVSARCAAVVIALFSVAGTWCAHNYCATPRRQLLSVRACLLPVPCMLCPCPWRCSCLLCERCRSFHRQPPRNASPPRHHVHSSRVDGCVHPDCGAQLRLDSVSVHTESAARRSKRCVCLLPRSGQLPAQSRLPERDV